MQSGEGGRTGVRPDQSELGRQRPGVWLSQGGQGPARHGRALRQASGGAPDASGRATLAHGLQASPGQVRWASRGGVVPNHLDRQFEPVEPNKVWATDITYIRTHEGWLYLAVVLDLFLRQVVGWSMGERMTRELAINALLMAVWRRKPTAEVMVHSDQGSQYSSHDWQDFLKAHRLQPSMSRRGNCHDNAVAESFFQLLKRERIRRQIYTTRAQARSDVFDYIEMFYNPKRRHGYTNPLSPVEFERQYFLNNRTV